MEGKVSSMEAKLAVRTILLTMVAPAVWGSTVTVTHLWLPQGRPLLSALLRILPAGLLMLLWLRRLPHGRWWGRSLVLGTLNHAVFFGLLYAAAYRLPSGIAASLTAVAPLVVMGIAWLALGERQPRITLGAAVAGVVGVVLLVAQGGRSGSVDLLGVGAAVGAVVSSSLGFVLVKRWTAPVDVLATTAWQLVAGGVLLLPVALVAEGAPPALDLSAVLALAYLGLVGSVVGYVVWFRGLTRMDAGAVAVVGLVNPVVGTLLGVLLLGEPFGTVHLAATALTLGSVLLAQAPVRRAVQDVVTVRRAGGRLVLRRVRTLEATEAVAGPSVGACHP
jgi:probable blue pigment (indigoidine) exporter